MSNVNRTNIGRGVVAGFAATIVLSALMLMKQEMGLMPQLNPIQMITQMMGAQTPVVGWVVNFFIGTIMCVAGSEPAGFSLVPRNAL